MDLMFLMSHIRYGHTFLSFVRLHCDVPVPNEYISARAKLAPEVFLHIA